MRDNNDYVLVPVAALRRFLRRMEMDAARIKDDLGPRPDGAETEEMAELRALINTIDAGRRTK